VSLFQPVYYIRDSGGVEIRVVGRPGIHHNVTVCFKIQEQRASKWVDIGAIERRCTDDPLKKGAIGAALMSIFIGALVVPGLFGRIAIIFSTIRPALTAVRHLRPSR